LHRRICYYVQAGIDSNGLAFPATLI